MKLRFPFSDRTIPDLMAHVNDDDITEMAFQNLLYTKASTDKQSEADEVV